MRRWGAAASSLVTLLALIVAPICAALCAAQACALPGAATEAPCHFAAAAQSNALHFHAAHICGARELQAADLTSSNLRSSLQAQRLRISAGLFDLLLPEPLTPIGNHGGTGYAYPPPPEHPSFPVTTVVLRI